MSLNCIKFIIKSEKFIYRNLLFILWSKATFVAKQQNNILHFPTIVFLQYKAKGLFMQVKINSLC
jgi:hypothetical protein